MRITHAGGVLVISRTAPGRGAWLCAASPPCLRLALERNAFARALRIRVPPALVEALGAQLATVPPPG